MLNTGDSIRQPCCGGLNERWHSQSWACECLDSIDGDDGGSLVDTVLLREVHHWCVCVGGETFRFKSLIYFQSVLSASCLKLGMWSLQLPSPAAMTVASCHVSASPSRILIPLGKYTK